MKNFTIVSFLALSLALGPLFECTFHFGRQKKTGLIYTPTLTERTKERFRLLRIIVFFSVLACSDRGCHGNAMWKLYTQKSIKNK